MSSNWDGQDLRGLRAATAPHEWRREDGRGGLARCGRCNAVVSASLVRAFDSTPELSCDALIVRGVMVA